MTTLPEVNEKEWARLAARLDALEARVDALEHPGEQAIAAAAAAPSEPMAVGALQEKQGSGFFPVLGQALLGIAGAYLLRAVAESAVLPRLSVAVVAMVFSVGWLFWARRVSSERFSSGIYAATSALIFAPMLWEVVLKFNLFSAPVAAMLLALYALFATALCWHCMDEPMRWISGLAVVLLAVGLAFGTHQPDVFFLVLCLLAAISEARALLNRSDILRWIHALAVDFTLWAMLFIYTVSTDHSEYAPLSTAALLGLCVLPLCLYLGEMFAASVLGGKQVMIAEIAQLAIMYCLSAYALFHLGGGSGRLALGVLCVALAAGSYLLALTRFAGETQRRNAMVYTGWGLVLLFAGALLLMEAPAASLLLAIAALFTVLAGLRISSLLYLLSATVLSGLGALILAELFGDAPVVANWAVWVTVCAAICIAVILFYRPGKGWLNTTLEVAASLLAIGTVAAVLLFAFIALTPLHTLGPHHIDLVRTLILCVLALVLAYISSYWKRRELLWIDYLLLLIAAGGVLFSESLHGHLAFSAAAIALVAVTFILLPRMMKLGQKNAR